MSTSKLEFPGGARFAFTILDDTDVATVETVRPIYRLFESVGMRTTKTVWMLRYDGHSYGFWQSETMEDPHYREFVIDLQHRGFEIAFHNASMETNTRDRTVEALDRFEQTFGHPPRVHANHSMNRENLYWGPGRVDGGLVGAVYRRIAERTKDYFQGHEPGSPYYWGDLCSERIDYVRNLTFKEINLLRVNPSMPYRDPARPLARWWFSTADAEGVTRFNALLHPRNQDRLEREGGVCIVTTHLGKGFCPKGVLNPRTRELIERLASRNGWFPTVSELLDWLRQQRVEEGLPAPEWRRMQRLWLHDLVMRSVASRLRERGRRMVNRFRRYNRSSH